MPVLDALPVAIVFGAVVCVVFIVINYSLRKKRLLHETVRKMVEKGVEIPPELLKDTNGGGEGKRNDLRNGINDLAFGIGLMLVLAFMEIGKLWAIGFVFVFAGIGHLLTWLLGKQRRGAQQPAGSDVDAD